jgi:glycosyltransferase involved in cell wall biosynthesis
MSSKELGTTLMPGPAVSICIPTFDRLPFLQEAVASARGQSVSDVEILVGDDGDSAELRRWCLSEAAVDARLRYLKTPQRLRLAGNWNFLAREARGEFVALIGDDDRLLPHFAERLLRHAKANVDVVFSNHFLIDERGNRLVAESRAITRQYFRDTLRPGTLDYPQIVTWKNSVPISASILRTDMVRRLGFKEDLNTPEIELFVRLAAQGGYFVHLDDYLSEYRIHPGSETAAGLKIDRLVEYLASIAVSPEVEATKRALLGPMAIRGVDIRLARGDVQGARSLLRSGYYPRPTTARTLAQRLVLALPDRAVSWVSPMLAARRLLLR